MRTIARALAYAVLVSALMAGIAIGTAGFWLAPNAKPAQAADAIVILAGGFERTLYAADLFEQGIAPRVLVSRPAPERYARQLAQLDIHLPREEDVHREILLRRGVPPGAIEFFGDGSLSTADEAVALRRLLVSRPQSLVVVTSPAHVRRAGLILRDAIGEAAPALQVVATPYERFDPYWWRDQGSARIVILEITKLAYYLAGGRFFSSPG